MEFYGLPPIGQNQERPMDGAPEVLSLAGRWAGGGLEIGLDGQHVAHGQGKQRVNGAAIADELPAVSVQ